MKVQVIKQEIPAEISPEGGAFIRFVNKETVDLETTVDEAKDQLCVVGDKLLVKGEFVGLFKSMVAGIQRDGNARQLGDFVTLYPVPTGEFDLDRGWDPAVNGVRIRARLMNEMEIDISNWEFEDVTPGRQAFKLESVKAGDVLGVIQLGQPVEINGKPIPLTDAIRIDWAVEETALSGTVPADKVTSTVSRADISADALAALNVPENDGRRIVFTVRGNFANAKIAALLKYVAPPEPVVTDVSSEGHVNEVVSGTAFAANGSGLDAFAAGDTAKVKWTQGGEAKEASITPASVTAEKMSFEFPAALQSVPMGTELTFEITFGETVKSKDSTLVGV